MSKEVKLAPAILCLHIELPIVEGKVICPVDGKELSVREACFGCKLFRAFTFNAEEKPPRWYMKPELV